VDEAAGLELHALPLERGVLADGGRTPSVRELRLAPVATAPRRIAFDPGAGLNATDPQRVSELEERRGPVDGQPQRPGGVALPDPFGETPAPRRTELRARVPEPDAPAGEAP